MIKDWNKHEELVIMVAEVLAIKSAKPGLYMEHEYYIKSDLYYLLTMTCVAFMR